MICGFDIKPIANRQRHDKIAAMAGRRAYQRYAISVSRKKTMASTVLRSATQATGSTLTGCSAKIGRHHEAASNVAGGFPQ